MAKRSTRVGAAAFALGLSLSGPNATGIAAANTSGENSGATTAGNESGTVAAGASAGDTGADPHAGSPKRTAGHGTRNTGPRPAATTESTSTAATTEGTAEGPRASTSAATATRPAQSRRSGAPVNTGAPVTVAVTTDVTAPLVSTTPTAGAAAAATATVAHPDASTTSGPVTSVAAAQATAAATTANAVAYMTAAVGKFVDSATNWVSTLPQSPITGFLQGAMLLVRRTLSGFLTATGWGQTGGTTTAASAYLSDEALRDYLLSLAKDRYGSLFGQAVPVYDYYWDYRYLAADKAAGGGPVSDTNTQVDGVDEADFVETDGHHLYVSRNGALTILNADSTVASQTALSGTTMGQFLAGDRLTVITQTGGGWYGPMVKMAPGAFWNWNWNPQTTVTVFDVSDPTAPVVTSQTVFDGAYQNARAVDGNVYLVLDRSINLPQPLYTEINTPTADLADNAAKGPTVVGYRVYETWDAYVARVGDQITTLSLPHAYAVGADGELVDLGVIAGGGDVVAPRGGDPRSVLNVVSIDSGASGAAAFASGVGSLVGARGATVYMTPTALYLATAQDEYSDSGSASNTRIDRFTVDGTSVDWQASGIVTGMLINQFAMDEQNGYLRVATHTLSSQFAGGTWATVNDNGVFILDTAGNTLDVVGSVTGLAPGEQLYAVRFAGDKAYLVTFLQTDPLFSVDISDPAHPTVEGELVIPGFSNYLQSVGDGLLMGIGQEREPGTWNVRMHVSLFDVSDGANLTQIDRRFLDENAQWSWSEAQFDHHAVLYSAEDGLLVVPVGASGYDPKTGQYRYDTTLQVLTVDATGITVRGVIHTDGNILRTVRIGDVLYAIGDDHVTAYSLTDLSEIGRTPLAAGSEPVPVYY